MSSTCSLMARVTLAPIRTSPRPAGPSCLLIPLTFGPSALTASLALSNPLPARNCLPLGKPSYGLNMSAGLAICGLNCQTVLDGSSTAAFKESPLSSKRVNQDLWRLFLPSRTSWPTSTRSTRSIPIRKRLRDPPGPIGPRKPIALLTTLLVLRPFNGAPMNKLRGRLPRPTTRTNVHSWTPSCFSTLLPARAYTGGVRCHESAALPISLSRSRLNLEKPIPPSLQPCRARLPPQKTLYPA